ncbi:hypothetical protein BDV12DRAFT_199033 [Aspergillus spectabilis]
MTSVTPTRLWGAPGSEASVQEPPKKSYDDGLYEPYNNAPPGNVAPPDAPSWQRKPTGNAAANPSLLALEKSTEPGKVREITANTTINRTPAAIEPSSVPPDPHPELQLGQFDHPLQSNTSTSASTITSLPTTTYSGLSAAHISLSTSSTSHASGHLTPGAQAGIVISIMSLAIFMIALILWRLHRKKRALQAAIRGEKHHLPREKQNAMCRHASDPYTRNTLTLVNVVDMFKAPNMESLSSISDGSSSIYSTIPTPPPVPSHGALLRSYRTLLWKNRGHRIVNRMLSTYTSAANMFADKFMSLPKKQRPAAKRRSRVSYEYGFSEESPHISPPEPARLQKLMSNLCANSSSKIHEKFKPQPPEKDNAFSTWSGMSSHNPYLEEGDQQQHAQYFKRQCEISRKLALVKVHSIPSSIVTMSNPADISTDALAGDISGEKEQHQQLPRQSPPPEQPSKKENIPSPQPATVQPVTQLTVSLVKLWTVQVYRVDMAFSPRRDGHLEVSEGQTVRLEQIFDDGWVLCTLTETEMQGLVPRACLSTWPMKECRQYAPSNTSSNRYPGSTMSPSPTDSESFRFYRQHSQL